MSNPTQLDPCGLGWTPKMNWVRLSWIVFNTLWWDGLKKALNPTQFIHTPLIVGVHVWDGGQHSIVDI